MSTAFEVAEVILRRLGRLDTIKLQKLVYYSQAWHLTWLGTPLFDDTIEAWDNGPVVRKLWEHDRGKYSVASIPEVEAVTMADESLGVVHFVCGEYGQYEGTTLRDHTHMESPWMDAYAQARNTVISHDAMRAFYSDVPGAFDSRWYWVGGVYKTAEAAQREIAAGKVETFLDAESFLAALEGRIPG